MTLRQAAEWARNTYQPALERIAESERRRSARRSPATSPALPASAPELIDRTTLVMSNRTYLRVTVRGGAARVLNTFDMRSDRQRAESRRGRRRRDRRVSAPRSRLCHRPRLHRASRTATCPRPGPERRSTGSRWSYNHVEITPAMMARAQAGGGPPGSQPWLQRAMRADPKLRVFVAAGRFNSLNMCEGNHDMVARLEPQLAGRFTLRCYEGGHMMYRDAPERRRLADDVRRFVSGARMIA